MLHIYMGTDWVQVRETILRLLAEDVRNQQGGRILMVPELISHDTERRLCTAAGDTASRYAEVLSFPRLARRVADSMGCAAVSCMDNGGRVVAMAAAARQLHSRVKAYAAVETKPDFLKDLVDAVDEFKRCCITPQDLANASMRTEGALAQKLEELSLLLGAYEGLCAQGKKDPRDQMSWLLEQLEDGTFGQEHVFYVDGFPDFTRQHLAILEHLIQVSPCVSVGLNCDKINSEAPAFEKAGATASELIQCAHRAGVPVQIHEIAAEESPLASIRGKLFQGKLPAETYEENLQVLQADSLWQEVQAAAEGIMELVRSGCRYRDISVVCADMEGYRNAVAMEFHRCGIPAYLSGTEDILCKSAVTTVLSALDAALGGFEQRDVLRYLKSVLSPLDQDVCDEVESYAVLWGVQGKHWKDKWVNHPDGLGQLWTEDVQRRLNELNVARELGISPLMALEKGFREAKDLAGQVETLYAFLERIGFAQGLDALAEEMDAQGDNRSAQILNQLWEILLGALEQMHNVLGRTMWEPEVFVRLFTLLLSQYDVGTIPPVLDAVTIGPISAMRCQQTKHLFVLGAQEGAFPAYTGAKGLLTDQERVALRNLGVPLTGGSLEGLQAEFAEIYGVFCGAEQSVWVSCSGQSSYIFRRLAQMAGGEKKAAPQYGAALADPAAAGAYLASFQDADAAKKLGLEQWYGDILHRTNHSLGKITRDSIHALYGSTLNLSASQIDRQAECRMSYFLKYGMRAKEQKEATIDPAEFGTYVHAVLENTAREVMDLGGFHEVSLEETMQIALRHADAYAIDHFSQIQSQRLEYQFRRNRRELEMVVEELWQELKESRFQPADFELNFGQGGAMPAIDIPAASMQASLRGFVDRVDIWKENGQNYFRVVDYKTGKKDFDYCDVFNGVGLQMLLYLFALQKNGDAIVGDEPVAAGVQYFPARVPLVAADGRLTDEEAEAVRAKEWKRKGLLLKDEAALEAMEPEIRGRLCCTRKKDGSLSGDLADTQQLKMLERHVFRVLEGMVEDIASGNVTPNPYTRGTAHNACTFCPYGAVCHQKDVQDRRSYKAMTAQRFWEEIEKEDRHG